MAAGARARRCPRGRSLPRGSCRLGGDLGRLGERQRRRLRGDRPGARLPGFVRADRDRIPASQRSGVAGWRRARSGGGRGAGAVEPLRAVLRQQQGARSVSAGGRRQAQLSDRLLERPGGGDGDRGRAAGLAGGTRSSRRGASGSRCRDPAAHSGRLSGLVAGRGGGGRGRPSRPPGGGPGAGTDVRGPGHGRGWGALLISLASGRHELVDALGNSTAAAQGDQMLAFTIGVVLAVGALRFLADEWLEGSTCLPG